MDKEEIRGELHKAAGLSLELLPEQIKNLFYLLQSGFYLEAEVGCTIEDFFLSQLNLSPEYIEKRIQGIFLNGKPADHTDTAIIRDGARLTLSGTMPGLAGMSLRSGPLAVFRHGITHRETGDYSYSGKGFVQLKILSLLMEDLGPGILQKGIYIQAAALAGYLKSLPDEFWRGCIKILLDGREVPPGLFKQGDAQFVTKMVKFSVQSS
ncbi:MAG: hypothetical protein JRF02_01495 [Deltaproteobacteria bacterium]|nr:hypothetical protein [Deltaproteobacteria bacterium]